MTALIWWPGSAASLSWTWAGLDALAPVTGDQVDVQAELPAICDHKVAKCPVSKASTRSPGDSVLTSAASQAPVPDEG